MYKYRNVEMYKRRNIETYKRRNVEMHLDIIKYHTIEVKCS